MKMAPATHKSFATTTFIFLVGIVFTAAPQSLRAQINMNHLIPNRALDHMVQGAEEAAEEGEIALAGPKQAAMSDSEFQKYINVPHNWFRSIGTGGTPYAKPVAMDSFAKVLSDEDQKLYRQIFEDRVLHRVWRPKWGRAREEESYACIV